MSDDLVRRWREAKLGERRGDRVAVWVECEGDPRAEVLGALQAERVEYERTIPAHASASDVRPSAEHVPPPFTGTVEIPPDAQVTRVTTIDAAGTVTIGDRPPRRKRGAK